MIEFDAEQLKQELVYSPRQAITERLIAAVIFGRKCVMLRNIQSRLVAVGCEEWDEPLVRHTLDVQDWRETGKTWREPGAWLWTPRPIEMEPPGKEIPYLSRDTAKLTADMVTRLVDQYAESDEPDEIINLVWFVNDLGFEATRQAVNFVAAVLCKLGWSPVLFNEASGKWVRRERAGLSSELLALRAARDQAAKRYTEACEELSKAQSELEVGFVRQKQVVATWLDEREQSTEDRVQLTMDQAIAELGMPDDGASAQLIGEVLREKRYSPKVVFSVGNRWRVWSRWVSI